MDDRILINPENRMLGTSGSNDFSLYGAQPDPALSFRPSPPAEAPEDASRGSAGPDPIQIQAPAAAPASAGSADSAAPDAPPSTETAVGAPQAAPPMPAVSAESGGSITPILPAPLLTSFDSNGLTAPSLAALSAENTSQDMGTISSVATPAFQDLDPPASAAVAPIAAAAPSLAEALPLDSVGQALPGLVAEIVPVDPLAPVADGIQDLLGDDPAGGIATLVSLVSISDVLDLGAVVTEGADPTIDPAADLIDMLVMDATGELAPPSLDAGEDDGADALLAVPLPPPDDLLDDSLGL